MSSMTTLTRCAARRTADQTRGYCLLVLGPHTHEKTGCGVHYFKRKTQLFRLSASLIASVIGPSFLVAGGYLFPGVIQGDLAFLVSGKFGAALIHININPLPSSQALRSSVQSALFVPAPAAIAIADSRFRQPPGEIGKYMGMGTATRGLCGLLRSSGK
jgi:hypothetical protein